jgi:hypothetical protein
MIFGIVGVMEIDVVVEELHYRLKCGVAER